MLTPRTAPPKDYYQNNCRTLFTFVLAHYAELLSPQESAVVGRYALLSNDAQRLMARLLTRKGPYFRSHNLSYAEISDVPQALAELTSAQLLKANPCARADLVLNLLKKKEIIQLFATCPRQSKSLSIMSILHGRSEQQILHRVYCHVPMVEVGHKAIWQKCLLLYFGGTHRDWSLFVRRDLGQTLYEQVELCPYHLDLAEFNAERALANLVQLSHRLDELPGLADALLQILQPAGDNRWQHRQRNKALLRIAHHLERARELERALDAYQLVDVHPARERQVRILTKLERKNEASRLQETIREHPLSDEELQFAQRFGQHQAGYQPKIIRRSITEVSERLESESIEQLAIRILSQEPTVWAVHCENRLVRTLTGLLYWPAIFATIPGAFTNPFQSSPNDLYEEDFVTIRAAQIDMLEAYCADDARLLHHLRSVHDEKQGVANDLVSWSLFEALPLTEILDRIPVDHIRSLSAFLIRNLREHRAGLPDLLVGEANGGYSLVEVKGPGDQLQPRQRVWLRVLEEQGIPSYVLRLQ